MDESAELESLRRQAKEDRKLIQRAERALAEIDRAHGLDDEHADVLAALRIRLEGKPRARLEDLLSATGSIGGKKGLEDILSESRPEAEWPAVEEKKKDWPGGF